MSLTLPAYGLDPSTLVDAPQCSASGEFCFLCQFEPDCEGNDLYTCITDLIEHMAHHKRELPAIVREVGRVYETQVRDSVEYCHEDTGEVIKRPEWSATSIKRHLLFSTQFSDLFDQIVRHILHSLVVRHNATMLDADTGDPIEEKRRALCDTLKSLQSWEQHIGVRGSPRDGAEGNVKKRRRKNK